MAAVGPGPVHDVGLALEDRLAERREIGRVVLEVGIEAELTGKLLAMDERIFEVPISYRARGREEGKKIQWTDGVEALWILAKIRLGAGKITH